MQHKTIQRNIQLIGVRQNNLKNITAEFPAKKISVITGLSGSGKSSLAFDTLYAEGQRRYIESLSTYTRQFLEKMPKPTVDTVNHIPPAIALEQKNHIINSRSTVGTQTEIIDYLRILYAKIGKNFCINCNGEVKKLEPQLIVDWAKEWLPGKKALIAAPIHNEETLSSKSKNTKEKKTKRTSSLFELLKEQGFQRILIRSKKIEIIEIDEINPKETPTGEIFVVVDRLRIANKIDNETQSRILDSIEQASRIGKGNIIFYEMETQEWKAFNSDFSCVQCGTRHKVPEPNLFSFNSPLGACARCSGFGYTLDLDEALVVPDPTKTLKNGAIDPFAKPSLSDWQEDLFRFAERHGISIGKRYRELTATERGLIWNGDPKDKTFPGIYACFEELKRWKYKLHIRVFIRRYQSQSLCVECKGARLAREALAVKVGDQAISDILNTPIHDTLDWLKKLKLSAKEKKIADEAYSQTERRLSLLCEVGVGYLTLSRLAKTLSGGEFQRINLATQLGNGLCGTLYVLDEPSIGLHAADTEKLIHVLKKLRDQGNTVVVVEHDLEVIRSADWLIELGPGAGKRGGEIIAQGTSKALEHTPGSITGKYLTGAFHIQRDRPPRPKPDRFLKLVKCKENNLKDITVEFPLNRFVVVTGVSGSGKSTLVHKTLYQALSRIYYRTAESPGKFERLYGAENLNGVVLLDQNPIGKSSRSNPVTYLKAWDEIRRIYANQVISIRRGYTPQHFSFNVDGGRCPVCKGEGEISVDMHFMAEVKIPCEECDGKRFKKKILDVSYRGKNVDQILGTTIDDAFELFRDNPTLVRKLGILRDVGLGYLQLGQSSTTLSGGESQRLKIAATLEDKDSSNLLYIFDEPTTGLHLEDIKKLLTVIQDLVEAKHSVIMIEHHLDVIAQADWVIDLGPGGGIHGGKLVASTSPGKLIEQNQSSTGKILKSLGYSFPKSEERSVDFDRL